MKQTETKELWLTAAMRRQSEKLENPAAWKKAREAVAGSGLSEGMKHLLGCWALQLAADGKKIPEKLISRKKSPQFQASARKTLSEDLGKFRISSLIAIICAVLTCMFLRAVMSGRYMVNFSVDAIIGAAAFAIMLVNVMTGLRTIAIYGKTRDYILADLSAVLLWYLLTIVWPQFDTSLVLFFVAYWLEKRRFTQLLKDFASENGIESASDL